MKELKIEAPQGYEVDKENSTFECIKFKKIRDIKNWDDLCEAGDASDEVRLSGYYIEEDSDICMAHRLRVNNRNRSVHLTVEEAKSARAAAMISQLMPYYGGAITKEEWADLGMKKHKIYRYADDLLFSGDAMGTYCFLAFRSKGYRDEFLKNNEQLVKEYLMID